MLAFYPSFLAASLSSCPFDMGVRVISLITHTLGFYDAKETLAAIIDGSRLIINAVMLPHG